ncbi:MAG: CoA-binding protein [Calditrichaceae bacterium]|nr:CoA-binding protein [Calditrichaceae bacterium]MBN2707753.1 CoA-binding protein [Calditrichaceae bacterium]RQV96388.1 MAG: CoA-binding protein [Calditrichota bacterium]
MASDNNRLIKTILHNSKTIAVVGLSDKEYKPSFIVARYLIENNYTIFPVNPNLPSILERKCFKNLHEINKPVDIVNIFRQAEYVLPIVEEAILIGAKTIWMQLGIVNKEATALAGKAGLTVIMDHCIKIEHSRVFNR